MDRLRVSAHTVAQLEEAACAQISTAIHCARGEEQSTHATRMTAAVTATRMLNGLIHDHPGDITADLIHTALTLERNAAFYAHEPRYTDHGKPAIAAAWMDVSTTIQRLVATACMTMGPARSDQDALALWSREQRNSWGEPKRRTMDSLDLRGTSQENFNAYHLGRMVARARSAEPAIWHDLERGDLGYLRQNPQVCADILVGRALQEPPDITTPGGRTTYAVQTIAIAAQLDIMHDDQRLRAWSSITTPAVMRWDFRCHDVNEHVLAHAMLDIAGHAWKQPQSRWAVCGTTAWNNAMAMGLDGGAPHHREQRWPDVSTWPAHVHAYALRQLEEKQSSGMRGTSIAARIYRSNGGLQGPIDINAALMPWMSTAPLEQLVFPSPASADVNEISMGWHALLAQPCGEHLMHGIATSIIASGSAETAQAMALQYAMGDDLLGQAGAIAVGRLAT